MRILRVTLVAALIAAIASTPAEAFRTPQLRRVYEFPMDHQSGGITASATRFYTGTDTGTLEERTHDGHLLNVRNVFNIQGGAGTVTFSNDTNRLGAFSQVRNDRFYFCSEDDNAVYRYNTQTDAMDRIAGNGAAGFTPGTGTVARVDCGNTAVTSSMSSNALELYMFSGRTGSTTTYGIVRVTVGSLSAVDAAVLTIVYGTGAPGHLDGSGTAAQFRNGYAISTYDDQGSNKYLILATADDQGPIRIINLNNDAVSTTAIQYDANAHVTGSNGAARVPHIVGFASSLNEKYGFGITTNSRYFTLSWSANLGSVTIAFGPQVLSGKWGATLQPNGQRLFFGNVIPGNGTLARLEVSAFTKSRSVPPTRTQTETRTLPSRTIQLTTPTPPTPKPATPAPTNAPVVTTGGLTTTTFPGQNTTIDSAAGASVFVISGIAAGLLSMLG